MTSIKQNKGFTLVELAIVMTIIGLLTGGVLKGQAMLSNAKIFKTSKQVKSFVAAYTTFADTYSSIPGDFPGATFRLPNCTNATGCYNGDSDGSVGTLSYIWNNGLGYNAVDTENTQFWTHLSKAGLITQVKNGGTVAWGDSHPASPIAGGFTVIQSLQAGAAGSDSPNGLFLRLHGSLTSGNTEYNPLISPKDAAHLDRLMDDGEPNTGNVRTFVYGDAQGCEDDYDEKIKKETCIMGFRIL